MLYLRKTEHTINIVLSRHTAHTVEYKHLEKRECRVRVKG